MKKQAIKQKGDVICLIGNHELMNFQGIFTHNLNMPVGMLQKLVSIERQTAWGWKPKTKLYDGIRKTYDYYLQEYKA